MRKSRQRRNGSSSAGITLLELVAVLTLAGALSFVGHGMAHYAKKNATRARARASLDEVYRTQILHCAVHGRFTNDFGQLHSIGLQDPVDPIYHFSLETPGRSTFICKGWANLDADLGVDSLLINETGIVRSLTSD